MSDISVKQNQTETTTTPFILRVIATGFFSGYSPIVPGTAGTLVGILIYSIPGVEKTLTLIIISLLTVIVGIIAAATMEKELGEDPQVVVIDEIAGMLISLILLPKTIIVIIIAFLFFRIYDIIKPPPARQVESFKNGWGIMLDDVFAGIYANISVRILILLFPSLV